MLAPALLILLGLLFSPSCGKLLHNPIFHQSQWARRTRRAAYQTVADVASNATYYTTIEIGTPPKSYNVILDMTLGDLALAGPSCTAGCPMAAALQYDAMKSSTWKNESTFTGNTFAHGRFSGPLFADNVSIGSHSVSQVDFVQISEVDEFTLKDPMSGFLGLGDSLSDRAFWKTLLALDDFDAPEFSFWLSRAEPGTQGATPGGAFVFGGVNSSLYSGDIEFIDASDFWFVQLSAANIQLDGKASSITFFNETTVMLDVGFPFVGGPADGVAALWAEVPGAKAVSNPAGFYTFPCNTPVNMSFSFGKKTWEMSAQDVNLGPVSINSEDCLGSIMVRTADFAILPWTFGVPFLRNVYSVFRQTPLTVGFAELSTLAGGTGVAATSTQASSSARSSPTTSSKSPVSSSPDSPSSSGTNGSTKTTSNHRALIGGVVTAVAAIAVIAGLVLFFLRRRALHRHNMPPTPLPAPDMTMTSFLDAPSGRVSKRAQMNAVALAPQRFGDVHAATAADASAVGLEHASSPGSEPPQILGRAGASPSSSDPIVLEALEDLRAEVRRLQRVTEPPPSYMS
ncbi:aspartic peptidase domain-containing protein [Mycena vulgaris]|nr:aspartic peptidase domain-containing protein [Mycena vulgaris]